MVLFQDGEEHQVTLPGDPDVELVDIGAQLDTAWQVTPT